MPPTSDRGRCPAVGVPLVLLRQVEQQDAPDLLDRLQFRGKGSRLSVFLFGGAKGVAAGAAAKINARAGCMTCVGTLDPGFCEVDEMSKDHIIEAVNASGADFLATRAVRFSEECFFFRGIFSSPWLPFRRVPVGAGVSSFPRFPQEESVSATHSSAGAAKRRQPVFPSRRSARCVKSATGPTIRPGSSISSLFLP